jgi:hypothetical protein
MPSRWAAVSILVLGLFLQGCSGDDKSSPTEPLPTTDTVAIETITPERGTTLTPGSRVTFQVRGRYTLASASTGRIGLVIEDQNFKNISSSVPQPSATVIRGGGTLQIADTITIPANNVTTVHVYLPLIPNGSSSSTAVDRVTYSVAR